MKYRSMIIKDTSSSIDVDNKKSLHETIGYCDSGEIYAYLIDDDSNGTNIIKNQMEK